MAPLSKGWKTPPGGTSNPVTQAPISRTSPNTRPIQAASTARDLKIFLNTGFSTKNNIAGKRKTLGFCGECYVSILVYFWKPSSEQHLGVPFLVEPNPQDYRSSAITLSMVPKDLWSGFLPKTILPLLTLSIFLPFYKTSTRPCFLKFLFCPSHCILL